MASLVQVSNAIQTTDLHVHQVRVQAAHVQTAMVEAHAIALQINTGPARLVQLGSDMVKRVRLALIAIV